MDDPWGAPWASSDHLSRRDPSPPPPTTFLSPPPKAFIGSATSSPELSLWAVGDETSDWAKSSTTLEQTPSHGWSPWADPEFQANNPSPRFDSRATKHPIAWPTNAAVSPGRKPIHSRSSSTLRQPSPDPWTLEHPWHEDADNGRCASRQSISLDSTLEGYSEPAVSQQAENVEGKDGSAIVAPTSQPTLLADMENGYKTTSISSVRTTKSIDEQVTSSASSRKSNELLTNYTSSSDGGSNKIVEVHASSENTGIAIERSHDLILHPESELELLQDPNHNSRVWPTFKEDQHCSTEYTSFEPLPSPDLERPDDITSKVRESKLRTSARRGPSSAVQKLTREFGAITFPVDLTNVDKLFGDIPSLSNGEILDDGSLLETTTNGLATMQQRRTWYRISRLGSSRKYDSGEEENYTMVAWNASRVHSEVIKVVRRWMEEDSFSGRATLGGSKRTSAFNWDSASSPINLDEVFAHKTRSRPSSTVFSAQTESNHILPAEHYGGYPLRKTSFASAATEKAASPTVSFGWNTTIMNPPSIPNSTAAENSTSGFLAPGHVIEGNVNPTPPLTPISNVPPQWTRPTDDPSRDDIIDGDDDWGEMTSPQQEYANSTGHPGTVVRQSLGLDEIIMLEPNKSLLSPSRLNTPGKEDFLKWGESVLEISHTSLRAPNSSIAAGSGAGKSLGNLVQRQPALAPELAVKASTSLSSADQERMRDDELIYRIIERLPDLSYML